MLFGCSFSNPGLFPFGAIEPWPGRELLYTAGSDPTLSEFEQEYGVPTLTPLVPKPFDTCTVAFVGTKSKNPNPPPPCATFGLLAISFSSNVPRSPYLLGYKSIHLFSLRSRGVS